MNFFFNVKKIFKYNFKLFIYRIINILGYKIEKKKDIYFKINYKEKECLKFDYIIFGLGRIGSKAIQSFINLHPEIYTISRKEIDKFLHFKYNRDNFELKDLNKNYQNKLEWLKKNNIKSVLVIHNNAGIYNKKNLKYFSTIAEKAILVVREPFGLIKSFYNHGIYNSLKPKAYYINSWGENIKYNKSKFNKKFSKIHKNYFEKKIKELKYHEVSNILKNHFSELHILDFSIISNNENIQKLFKVLQIKSFYHEAFDELQSGIFQRYFQKNYLNLKISNSFYLRCRFSVNPTLITHNDEEPTVKIIEIPLKKQIVIKNLKIKKFYLICEEKIFNCIKSEDRKFINKNYLDLKFIEKEFIKMSEKIKYIEMVLDRVKEEHMNENFRKIITSNKNNLKIEVEKFVENHSEFVHYRDSINNLLK